MSEVIYLFLYFRISGVSLFVLGFTPSTLTLIDGLDGEDEAEDELAI